jgi:hypothetical protein
MCRSTVSYCWSRNTHSTTVRCRWRLVRSICRVRGFPIQDCRDSDRSTELSLRPIVDHPAFEAAMQLVLNASRTFANHSHPTSTPPASQPSPSLIPLPPAQPVPPRLPMGQCIILCCDACHVRKVHLFNPSGIKWHRDPSIPLQGLQICIGRVLLN